MNDNSLNKSYYLGNIYSSQKDADFAKSVLEKISKAYEEREKAHVMFNGMSYTEYYRYNARKALNYAPPKGNDSDSSNISLGLPHEKIVGFVAIFLKYNFVPRPVVYDKNGAEIEGFGDVLKLAVEYTRKLERFHKKIGVIYWELFTQGDAFVLEDYVVENRDKIEQVNDSLIDDLSIQNTLEFLENAKWKSSGKTQTRKLRSVLLDGRQVILADLKRDDAKGGLQAQPFIVIEEYITKADAERLYGNLKMFKKIPNSPLEIPENNDNLASALFAGRGKVDWDEFVVVHRFFSKDMDKFNIFVNGVMMLPADTPMSVVYPRFNYPIAQFSAERSSGSAYSRSIPAKVKFNSDFVDWMLNAMAFKLEQELDPPLLLRGKYELTKDMFKPGARTKGVSKTDYEFALPDNARLTSAHFSFIEVMRDILERQTINPTTSGELSGKATATEVAIVEQNQRDKLAYLLDGMIKGYVELNERRIEMIESRFLVPERKTYLDGEIIDVYSGFSVDLNGISYNVIPAYNINPEDDELKFKLLEASLMDKARGKNNEYVLFDANMLNNPDYNIFIDIVPEKVKDSALQIVQLKDEFSWLLATFPNVNIEELQREYLKLTGKPDQLFIPMEMIKYRQAIDAQQEGAKKENVPGEEFNTGSFGQNTMKYAQQQQVLTNRGA